MCWCVELCVHGIINQAQHSIAQTGNQLSNELVTTGVHLSLVYSSQPTHSQVSADAYPVHVISKMTCTVSSGTLNSTILYHSIHRRHYTKLNKRLRPRATCFKPKHRNCYKIWSWSIGHSQQRVVILYNFVQKQLSQHTKCDT